MVLSLLLLAWKHYKVHTVSIRTAFVTIDQNIISTTRYPLPKKMTNVNISIRRLEHSSLHSMAPRSYLNHPHNVRHEHLCQYNRLAASCDFAHPDHRLRLLPCGRWRHNSISCDVSECVYWMCMLIMVIFNTEFRCTLIAMNYQTKNVVSVLYAKYGDYGIDS